MNVKQLVFLLITLISAADLTGQMINLLPWVLGQQNTPRQDIVILLLHAHLSFHGEDLIPHPTASLSQSEENSQFFACLAKHLNCYLLYEIITQ